MKLSKALGAVILLELLYYLPALAQDTNIDWGTASDDQVILQAIEQTTPTPFSDVPVFANFYSAQHSPISSQPWPPLPIDVAFNAWELGSNVWVLDDLDFDYNAPQAQTSHSMMAMDDGGIFPPGDDGTNTYFPAGSPVEFDYGTNLWIAQETVSGGNFTGIISNTIADVSYQLLLTTNLASPQWVDGSIVVGSETTNWTPWSVPYSVTNNLFVNVLSLQDISDMGIPSYWLLQNFGQYTNVNINALAPANDGWTIYQQYAMGISADTWATPPAPQGLTVLYNPNNNTASISWLPSPGPVLSYTVQRLSLLLDDNSYYDINTSTTNAVDNLPTISDEDLAYEGPTPAIYYQVQATYAGGASAWSYEVELETFSTLPNVDLAEDSQGNAYLNVLSVPPGTVALKVTGINVPATYNDNLSENTNFSISITSSTNGLYAVQNYFEPGGLDYERSDYYEADEWFVQAVNTNGSLSMAAKIGTGYTPPTIGGSTNTWLVPPFYDGREQLKQNLIFLLRNAGIQPFSYDIANQYEQPEGNMTQEPAGYATAGFYDTLSSWNGYAMSAGGNGLDVYRPFYENYLFANFMFSLEDLNEYGDVTNRIEDYLSPAPPYDPAYLLLTDAPPLLFQQPTVAGISIPSQLNDTQWLYSLPFKPTRSYETNGVYYDLVGDGFTYTIVADNGRFYDDCTMQNPAVNYFGVQIESAEAVYLDESGTLDVESESPGNSFVGNVESIFPQAAQPQLQAVEYDFWNADSDTLPGNSNFSPTTPVQHFQVTSAGGILDVAGYAKMAVQNGYPGVYGYLGQYFDQAYQIDTNGNVTTNSAGALSPYGRFFDTQPGPVALVTMPDVDTGQRGTDTVYALKLQLDVNHDGTMDLSSSGPDNTSEFQPYAFWCNNNFDRWRTDTDHWYAKLGNVYYSEDEQDDQENGPSGYYPYPSTPDCNYLNADGNRQIPCTRDLEDFSRLWLCGVTSNLLASLPAGASVTLSMNPTAGSVELYYNGSSVMGQPTIDLFAAADPDGGIGYQTNETIAMEQTNLAQCPYIGRIGPNESIQLNSLMNGLPTTHFIWCGVSNGIGQLTLTISNGSNILGQTSAYIQIMDIKQMYERWTVGNDYNALPTNVPSLQTEGLPSGLSAFQYPAPQGTTTPYFLFVHGYNMAASAKDFFANTAYKRLYWQGYQGRFGAFQWPTTVANLSGPHFDQSEYESWNSGAGLLNLLTNLNREYPGQVYVVAHSHGNVATGEALRQATKQGLGQIVNTYITMQAALDSHTYDPTTPERSFSFSTPDRYGQYYTDDATNYFNGVSAAGTFVNFYNTNDWTLASNVWQADEDEKPDVNYGYTPEPDYWYRSGPPDYPLFFPQDTYTIFAYCDQGHAYSVGAQPNVGGVFSTNEQISLPSIWPPDPSGHSYADHLWHSAEFRSDYPQRWLFWNEVLTQMKLNSNP